MDVDKLLLELKAGSWLPPWLISMIDSEIEFSFPFPKTKSLPSLFLLSFFQQHVTCGANLEQEVGNIGLNHTNLSNRQSEKPRMGLSSVESL